MKYIKTKPSKGFKKPIKISTGTDIYIFDENNKKSRRKSFIGGCVCGLLAGALIGGYTVAVIMGTAFINYNLNQEQIETTISKLK